MKHNPGIGATPELSLRVSVATLVRVLFENPTSHELMLALEQKATLHETENGPVVGVKSQPFGGAIRIFDGDAIHDLIGDFNFDSERSRAEQDFRIFIRPSCWSVLREFCIQHLSQPDDPILETNFARELVEEFYDTLNINLEPEQYVSMPVATAVEDEAAPTTNLHARGLHTVRVYRIFETSILDPFLIQAMMKNNESLSHQVLRDLALEDARNSSKGRANKILALPLRHITDFYLAINPKDRNAPVLYEGNRLEETVPAILEDVPVSKYQRL